MTDIFGAADAWQEAGGAERPAAFGAFVIPEVRKRLDAYLSRPQ